MTQERVHSRRLVQIIQGGVPHQHSWFITMSGFVYRAMDHVSFVSLLHEKAK